MSAQQFFKVRNWQEFQHYKDRCPPWIKLYNDLLEDYEFSLLEDHQKFQLIGIFLLATRTGNKIPSNPKWVQKKIDSSNRVELELFLEYRFIELISDSGQEAEQPASKTESETVQQATQGASAMLASCTSDRIQSKGEIYRDRESIGEDAEPQQQQPDDPEREFPMFIGWHESDQFATYLAMAGVPDEVLNPESRTEFISHWASQHKVRHNQRKWENVFLKSLTTRYRSGKHRGPNHGQQESAADRLRKNLRQFEELTDDGSSDYVPQF